MRIHLDRDIPGLDDAAGRLTDLSVRGGALCAPRTLCRGECIGAGDAGGFLTPA
jgi:hypothetical protein